MQYIFLLFYPFHLLVTTGQSVSLNCKSRYLFLFYSKYQNSRIQTSIQFYRTFLFILLKQRPLIRPKRKLFAGIKMIISPIEKMILCARHHEFTHQMIHLVRRRLRICNHHLTNDIFQFTLYSSIQIRAVMKYKNIPKFPMQQNLFCPICSIWFIISCSISRKISS